MEWAEDEIWVPQGGPLGGTKYRHSVHPVSRHWFGALDSGRWSRHALTGPQQNGKSWLGYVLPTLYHLFEVGERVIVGIPDLKMAADKWQDDFLPAIMASSYRDLIPTQGESSRGGQIKSSVVFRNGAELRFMSSGGGDEARAGKTSRVLAATEVDKYDESSDSSREGSKLAQMEGRLNAFDKASRLAREYLECTVSIESGAIWQAWSVEGTGSYLASPCPCCGEYVSPEREHLVGWERAANEIEAGELARWACPDCGEMFGEEQRRSSYPGTLMAHRGQTISRDGAIDGDEPKTLTFSLRWSAFHNPFKTTASLGMSEWAAAKSKDKEGAEKVQRQFVWALPYSEPNIVVTELLPEAAAEQAKGMPRGIVPPNTIGIAVGIDTHKRILYWEAKAVVLTAGETADAPPGLSLHVIDYGTLKLDPAQLGRLAIYQGLRVLKSKFDNGWRDEDGKMWAPSQVWIDSGYAPHLSPVLKFLAECSRGLPYMEHVWRASKGHGEGQLRTTPYRMPEKRDKRVLYVGTDYWIARVSKEQTVQMVHVNADTWKGAFLQGFSVDPGTSGEVVLFRADMDNEQEAKDLDEYTTQICAEIQKEKWVKDRGTLLTWVQLEGRANHYLDCGYLSTAAADFIVANRQKLKTIPARQAMSQMQGRPKVSEAVNRYVGRPKLADMVRR